MTNETIRNVPRELLERASNLAFQTQHYPLHEELRAILSVPLPADHVEDVRAMVKAQGVVMPEGWIPLTIEHEPGYPEDVAFGPKRMMDRLKKWLDRYFEMRLNAAPVQQVSVPASAFASRAITHYEAALLAAFPSGSSGEVFNQWNEARRVLNAAPAAPSQGEQVRVVPVEPTEAMRKAAQDKLASEGLIVTDWLIHTAYSAMLNAAPVSAGDDEFCDGNCTWLDHHPSCARAAAPAAPAADGWISVSERLPGEDDQVLCWCEDETVAWAEVSSHHNSFFTDMTHELLPVTHWMPLPAAPSANSDQGVV